MMSGSFAERDLHLRHPVTKLGQDIDRMPYLLRSSSAKEPYKQWFFCGKRPAI